jgi:predicted MFS family arabinose efflux permease
MMDVTAIYAGVCMGGLYLGGLAATDIIITFVPAVYGVLALHGLLWTRAGQANDAK